jgi:quercetin dioxygenase-like cupin family protein
MLFPEFGRKKDFHMGQAAVVNPSEHTFEEHDWGHLEWIVSGKKGNSEKLTVGKCFIKPGRENPPHYHPNCDEVLHVLQGTISHRIGDEFVRMSAGDTVSIPTGMLHNASNVGTDEAIFLICFSSADRQAVGEGLS